MDPVTIAAMCAAGFGMMAGLGGTWLRGRVQSRRAREEARRDHLRRLPPGSRIVDLGPHGMVIEVGHRTPAGPGGENRPADDR